MIAAVVDALDQRTTVVIPTRNRADLASAAISSVLDQGQASVRVVVSDNSTEEKQSSRLKSFCVGLDQDRVIYIRPHAPMAMSAHWEWALGMAMGASADSHFTYLSDRMIFKQGVMRDLIQIARGYPDRVITYNDDMLDDSTVPVQLYTRDWTGKVFEIDSAHLLHLSSRAFFPSCIPRMLNSLVPRILLDEMRTRFGNVFASISPDFYFAYRCLFLLDSIFYYDRPALLQYAITRSNGMSYARGLRSIDNADFIAQLAGKPMNFATPIPELQSVVNAVMNEYCVVKTETGSPKFPDVDRRSYLGEIGLSLRHVRDRNLASKMRLLLRRNGWTEIDGASWYVSRLAFLIRRQPSWVLSRLAQRVGAKVLAGLAARIGVKVDARWILQFSSAPLAIQYANESPSKRTSSLGYLRRCKLTEPPGHIREVSLSNPVGTNAEAL